MEREQILGTPDKSPIKKSRRVGRLKTLALLPIIAASAVGAEACAPTTYVPSQATETTQPGKVPYDVKEEKEEIKRLEQPTSILSETDQEIRDGIIKTADAETGFIPLAGAKDASVEYDKNDGAIQGQILSPEGIIVVFDGKKHFVFNGQLEVENWFRSKGMSQQGICNSKLSWDYDPQNFTLPKGVVFTSAPLSCFFDTTKLFPSPTTNP